MTTSPLPSQFSLIGGYLDLAGAAFAPGAPLAGIDAEGIAAFNSLLHTVVPDATPIDAGLLGTMARQLMVEGPGREQAAASIQRRIKDIATLSRMAADPAWRLPGIEIDRIRKVNEYFESENDLIPDDVADIGLLDDAILIELVARALRPELDDYADFCHQRELREKALGVEPGTSEFERRDWLALKRAQARARGERSSFD
jgi:hypothetical protein